MTVNQTARVKKRAKVSEARRKALIANIALDKRFLGNQSAFARAVGKSASQINDMIRGNKSFGEKVARDLERRAGWDVGILDHEIFREGFVRGLWEEGSNATDKKPDPQLQLGLTPNAITIARIWDQLPPFAQEFIAHQIQNYFQFQEENPEYAAHVFRRGDKKRITAHEKKIVAYQETHRRKKPPPKPDD